ncbi:hypothetical protein GOBAR_AA27968 [Gossypium barbadense]|uniref:HTH myb-type domain-containing protein n=1 Tax=Gossypium barbadense TaxID=3634 RepID=A0A2P5WNM9_GOSBA|nr:hypothetical protein GOBAR_AA27968 [Gossypium barbadense]
MELQKRLDYGFNGYQVPATPRATRSARKRVSFKKRVEDNRISAFDLLATVAGKLLLDKESTPVFSNTSSAEDPSKVEKNTVKEERWDGSQSSKLEICDQYSNDREFIVSQLVSQTNDLRSCSFRESPSLKNDTHFGLTSVVTTSDCSERSGVLKLMNGKIKNETGCLPCKVETGPFLCGASGGRIKLEFENKGPIHEELDRTDKLSIREVADTCPLEDPVVVDGKPPLLRDDLKVVSRDDDEKSSRCTYLGPIKKPFRPTPLIGDRRIRKTMTSKYLKVAPRLNDVTLSNSDENLKSAYCDRSAYKRIRSERNYPFKKRKFLHYSSVSNSDGGISSEGISDSPEQSINGNASGVYPKMRGVTGESPSLADQRKSFHSRDSHGMRAFDGVIHMYCFHLLTFKEVLISKYLSFYSVKFRIKSFRVPELFIEIPESATIGSLKCLVAVHRIQRHNILLQTMMNTLIVSHRTVMEAVTAILGGGLRIGVLLQGKKVRDDNKTLLQTGISRDNQMDALGFSLEPNPSQTFPSHCPGGSPLTFPCDMPLPLASLQEEAEFLLETTFFFMSLHGFETRSLYPATPGLVARVTHDPSYEPHMPNLGHFVESDHDSAPSPTDMSLDKSTTDSKALVAVPAISVEALDVVPAHRKSKQSEVVQRRIRRPFSVAEVEALVQAVEKLGTGRWRDVKLRAFDNAKHRTYVDLKARSCLCNRISGKHLFIQREYRHSKGGENRCLRSSWTGS